MDSLSGVGVLDKAVALLATLAAAPHGLSLTELHVAAGLPRATAHRLAVALDVHGLVRRNDDGRFLLGLGLIPLGRAAADGLPLAGLARPVLEELRDRTGESVQLYVREGDHRRCVVSLPSPHALRWIVPEGSLLPLDRGSAGKVLTAPAPGASPRPGPGSDEPQWVASVEEREPGVASVSAAVFGRAGQVVAAVSVSGPVERMTRQPGRRFGADVRRAASSVAERLSRVAAG